MKTLQDFHDYWIDPSVYDKQNDPITYLKLFSRSNYLYNLISKYVNRFDPIVELGCNSCRNLIYLNNCGYDNLIGVEISKKAIDVFHENYPDKKNIMLTNSSIEDWIKQVDDNRYKLVFTMAVLEHIHPDSEWVFEDIVRISDKYLLTIEDEVTDYWRIVPRNYQVVFENLGMKQIFSEFVELMPNNRDRFICRLFEIL